MESVSFFVRATVSGQEFLHDTVGQFIFTQTESYVLLSDGQLLLMFNLARVYSAIIKGCASKVVDIT